MTAHAPPGHGTWERLRRAVGVSRTVPRVRAELVAPVPAWTLRLAQVTVVLACVAIAAPNGFGWMLGIALAAMMVLSPNQLWPAALVLWLGVVVVLDPGDPFAPRTFLLLLGAHLLVVLSAVLDRIPLTALVELPVLVRPARRFVAVQVFSQSLALVGAWVASRDVSAVWVAVVVGVAIATGMWALSIRLDRAASDSEGL